MMMLMNAEKEDANAREIAQELAELLPESPDRAAQVLEFLRELIELPEPVTELLWPVLRIVAAA
jgi:gamma-glutamyl phosphate reductase